MQGEKTFLARSVLSPERKQPASNQQAIEEAKEKQIQADIKWANTIFRRIDFILLKGRVRKGQGEQRKSSTGWFTYEVPSRSRAEPGRSQESGVPPGPSRGRAWGRKLDRRHRQAGMPSQTRASQGGAGLTPQIQLALESECFF